MTRRDIQILRGVSLIGVLFFHANNTRFQLGYLGVDLFFVISGFVIVPRIQSIFSPPGSLRKEIRNFYIKRVLRLAPALIFSVSIFAPLIIVLGNVRDLETSSTSAFVALLFVGNLFPIGTKVDYFNSGANPFIHAWSLGLEFQIYIFLPLLFLLLLKYFNFRLILLSVTALSFILYLNLLFNPIFDQYFDASNIAFYSPISRFWEFGIGGLVGQFLSSRSFDLGFLSDKIKKICVLLIICLLIIPVHLNATFTQLGVVFLASVYLGLHKPLNSKPAKFSILLWIGDRSYSIYLVHLPLMYLAKYSPVLFGFADREIRVVISLFLSLAIGAFCYSYIENRYRAKLNAEVGIVNKFKLLAVYLLAIVLACSQVALVNLLNVNNIVFNGSDVQQSTEWDRNCKLTFRYSPCEYNSLASGGSILLLGDSHAAMFGKVFQSIAVERNLKLYIWASPACQFFIPQKSRKSQMILDSCESNNLRIQEWVAKNTPEHLFLSVIDSSLNSVKYSGNSESYAGNIVKSMEMISHNSISKTIILPTPKLNEYSSVQYLLNDGGFELDRSYRKEIRMWLALSVDASITTISSLTKFCSNSICRKKLGNKNLYADTDHLTVAGANQLRQDLIRALEP